MENTTEILLELGLNKLESEVYMHLLTHPPLTAYKIGKQINKPTANVYKAIDALATKGAVIVEDNKNKLCRAVAPDEFVGMYENLVMEKTKKARDFLCSLKSETEDEKTYSIQSVPLVFERFRAMMARCKSIAVVDAFPKTLEKVKIFLEEAALRGVEVHVEAYQPVEIGGTFVTCAGIGSEALEHWQSQQLNLVIDGEEHLIALLDNDLKKVKQAVWSSNTYMSCLLHAGMLREQTVMKIMAQTNSPDFEIKAKQVLEEQKFFFNTNVPGFTKLFNRNKNETKL